MLSRIKKLSSKTKLVICGVVLVLIAVGLPVYKQIRFEMCFNEHGAGLTRDNKMVCHQGGNAYYNVWG